jgi:hypothetical protein
MPLKFRLHTSDDLEGMRQMWIENTDWGAPEQLFNDFILNACLDGACVLLALDEAGNELVGQFAFLPYLVKVHDRIFKAYRPIAPIVSKSYRYFKGNPFEHPAIRMYNEGVNLLRARGDGLIFMAPSPSWLRLLKMFPQLRTGSFPLFSRSLDPSGLPALPLGTSYGPLSLSDSRIDLLWQRHRDHHACCIVRDSLMMTWKIGKGDHQIYGVERSGELVGLLACKRKGFRQWLVDDLMFADCEDSLRSVAIAAVQTGQIASAEGELDKVGILTTVAMRPVLDSLGFSKDNYDFPFVVQPLAADISIRDIDPIHWFVTAND